MSNEATIADVVSTATPEAPAPESAPPTETPADARTAAIKAVQEQLSLPLTGEETDVQQPVVAPVEAAPPVVEETKKPDVPDFNEKFETLAREQQRMRQLLESKESSLTEREKKLLEKEQKLSNAALNPLAALEAMGISFDQLNQFVLNNNAPTAEMRAAAAEAEARKTRQEWEKYQQTLHERDIQHAVSGYKSKISDFIKTNADSYELTLADGAHELIYNIIDNHIRETGQWLGGDPDAAIKLAADKMEQMLEKRSEQLLQTKKLKSKLAPATTMPASAPQVGTSAPKTISNNLSGRAPPRAKQEDDVVDTDELRARTARLLRENGLI